MKDGLLRAKRLSKRYGGVHALTDVGFSLNRGEIHGLCGENGAGKSTVVKILGGVVKPDSGEILIDGVHLRLGERVDPSLISIVHQELSIIPELSVLDNILIGKKEAVGFSYRRSRYEREIEKILEDVGLQHIRPNQMASELMLAERQLLEIARGIARNAKILLLDEPTATLSEAEIAHVFHVLRTLRDKGASLVIISHRLDEIFALTDQVTVFRSGRHIWTKPTKDTNRDELVEAMIGRPLVKHEGKYVPLEGERASSLLSMTGLGVPGKLQNLDCNIGSGEIVAISGQLGSGADTLVQILAGLHSKYEGTLSIENAPVQIRSQQEAMSFGVAYVPEDRAGMGVFLNSSIRNNLVSHIMPSLTNLGWLSEQAQTEAAQKLAVDFGINPKRVRENVSVLSGGNQQKVAIAKAVATTPRLLVLNEPTRGVDVGARDEIYKQLRILTQKGMAVVFYSSDLDEIVEVADRVVTIYKGKMVRILSGEQINGDDVLHDILHGA